MAFSQLSKRVATLGCTTNISAAAAGLLATSSRTFLASSIFYQPSSQLAIDSGARSKDGAQDIPKLPKIEVQPRYQHLGLDIDKLPPHQFNIFRASILQEPAFISQVPRSLKSGKMIVSASNKMIAEQWRMRSQDELRAYLEAAREVMKRWRKLRAKAGLPHVRGMVGFTLYTKAMMGRALKDFPLEHQNTERLNAITAWWREADEEEKDKYWQEARRLNEEAKRTAGMGSRPQEPCSPETGRAHMSEVAPNDAGEEQAEDWRELRAPAGLPPREVDYNQQRRNRVTGWNLYFKAMMEKARKKLPFKHQYLKRRPVIAAWWREASEEEKDRYRQEARRLNEEAILVEARRLNQEAKSSKMTG